MPCLAGKIPSSCPMHTSATTSILYYPCHLHTISTSPACCRSFPCCLPSPTTLTMPLLFCLLPCLFTMATCFLRLHPSFLSSVFLSTCPVYTASYHLPSPSPSLPTSSHFPALPALHLLPSLLLLLLFLAHFPTHTSVLLRQFASAATLPTPTFLLCGV